jgi:hypothetical protein
MTDHSLINASGNTHAKMAFLALAASVAFMAVVSASGLANSAAPGARAHAPVIKAVTTLSVARSDAALIR